MMNLYGIDLIIEEDSTVKVIDVNGSNSAGIYVFRSLYGRTEAKERIEKYLSEIAKYSGGKLILMLWALDSPRWVDFGQIGNELLLHKLRHLDPDISWIEKWNRPHAKSFFHYKEKEDFEKAAKRLGLKLIFCRDVEKIGGGYLAKDAAYEHDEQTEDLVLKKDEIGVLVRRALHNTPCFDDEGDFPIVHDDLIDLVLGIKWFLRELLKGTDYERHLPRGLYTGMGLSSKRQILEFIQSLEDHPEEPLLVSKPVAGFSGRGLQYLNRSEAVTRFKLNGPEYDIDPEFMIDLIKTRMGKYTWNDIFECPSLPSGIYGPESRMNKDVIDFVAEPEKREQIKQSVLSQGKQDEVCWKVRELPFFQYTTGILEEFVHTRPFESKKKGGLRKGYIRALVAGDFLLGAMHRFPVKEYQQGRFIDLTQYEERTFFEKVDEQTEKRLEELLVLMVLC